MTNTVLTSGVFDGRAKAWRAFNVRELPLPATFGFDCYGTHFDIAVVRDGGEAAKLAILGHLGPLPYSAESTIARQYIKSVVNVGGNLPYAEISLSRKQEITIQASMEFPGHPTPAIVVAAAAAITIAVKPFIDMISMLRNAGKSTA